MVDQVGDVERLLFLRWVLEFELFAWREGFVDAVFFGDGFWGGSERDHRSADA